MSARRAILVTLGCVLVGLLALFARLSHVQESALAEGVAAAAEGREARAIQAFRRAVRAHHLSSSRTDEALARLLALGVSLEARGDSTLAELAYLSAWGGMNATEASGRSSHPLAREAEARLVRLRGEPLDHASPPARPLGKAAAASGLALALLAGFRLLSERRDAVGTRLVLLEISLFLAGMSLFVAGVLHA